MHEKRARSILIEPTRSIIFWCRWLELLALLLDELTAEVSTPAACAKRVRFSSYGQLKQFKGTHLLLKATVKTLPAFRAVPSRFSHDFMIADRHDPHPKSVTNPILL